MEDSAFSDDFCQFIHASVPSVFAAELLLFLLRQPDRSWDAAEIARDQPGGTVVSESEARKALDLLAMRGLAESQPGTRFRYRPASPELDAQVRTLARVYNERPVTLIRMIYALRDSKIRSFADAFKFRKS